MFTIQDEDAIRVLAIDQPGRRNAIPADGWALLHSHLRQFEASQQRVLIITGSSGSFCAGADLSDGARHSGVAQRHQAMRQIDATAAALVRMTKPTIAAVDGVAVGAGMNLALACDVVVASTTARFAEIFAKRGLTLDFGGSWLLPRIVGMQRAKELALSARFVEAAEALAIGLCIDVVEPADLLDRARAAANSFMAGAPVAQMFIKQALNRSFEVSLEQALATEAQAQAICLTSQDAREGVTAFLEKRVPEWTGR